jgi:hypothetical protein
MYETVDHSTTGEGRGGGGEILWIVDSTQRFK